MGRRSEARPAKMPNAFSDVFGDEEAVELELSESHECFEGVGVIREGVIVAGNRLNPDGGDKAEPFSGRGRRREFYSHGRMWEIFLWK